MSKQNPVVLFVGRAERAAVVYNQVDSEGWIVYHPAEMLEALGNYIFYYPDVVVIEDAAEVEFAAEVYDHLRSINAENIILLTDTPEQWEVPMDTYIRVLPLNIEADAIIDLVLSDDDITTHLPV